MSRGKTIQGRRLNFNPVLGSPWLNIDLHKIYDKKSHY